MTEGSMSKCGSSKIKVERIRVTTVYGGHLLFYDAFMCEDCGYTELYFREKGYWSVGHGT